jgi:transposase
MKAYSQDLRQRMLRAVDVGHSQAETAKTFTVSLATIGRYLKQRRETGHVKPKAIPGRPAVKGAKLQAHLLPQLEAYPDATREEHCQMFEATYGITVSPASITRARTALGWTRKKKTLSASEQDETARAAWREQASHLTTQELVIVDETGTQINMTPLYAYAPRGERAVGTVPTPLRGQHDVTRILVGARHGRSHAAGWLGRWRRF